MAGQDSGITVLLIEENARPARELERLLTDFGLDTVLTGDVNVGLEIAALHLPDAILAAADAPPNGAMDLCQRVHQCEILTGCPVLVYARRYDPLQAAYLLDAGAADYTHYAINPRELVSRVRRMVRRAEPRRPKIMKVGEVLIDGNAFQVRIGDRPIAATTTEFRILQSLASEPGRVFSRQKLAALAGFELYDTADRTVDAHVKNIRKKLGGQARLLQTVRGFGYRLVDTAA